MANIGFCKPYIAKYTVGDDGTVSYSGGKKMAKGTSLSFSPETSDDNVLYGDNGPAESDKEFGGGTLEVGITELALEDAGLLLGLTVEDVTLDGEETASGTRVRFGGDTEIPYIGLGAIVTKKVNGKAKHRAVIFPKTQFAYPGDDYETKGESITWKTPALSASVMRDDTAAANWREWAEFDTEANAEKYIKQWLNITESSGGGTEPPAA